MDQALTSHLVEAYCREDFDRRESTRPILRKNRRGGSTDRNWQGVGELSLTVWNSYRRGAAPRGLEFTLTQGEAWELFLSQDRRCALSGLRLSFGQRRRYSRTASLDRIDSTKGYVLGNVQWTHKFVNRMKGDMPDPVFRAFCHAVAKHRP